LIMGHVLISLAPAAIFGVVIYGLPALGVILVSMAAAAAGEALFRLVTRQKNRIRDLSAAVTGLLLALVLPPATPLWMTALGAVFAVVVAKEFFGGLGANVFNPALSGRAFLLMSFPAAITTWTIPGTDGVSGATPLGIIKMGGDTAEVGRRLTEAGLSAGADYASTLRTLFIGNRGGTIGESSIMLIAAGCLYLLITKVIDWRAPLAMLVSAFTLALLLGMDPVFGVLAGGLCFGAVFMATDYTTAPMTAKGKVIFGAGAGIITVLIRKWGNYPEGVTYGILIMNAVTPFLNRLLQKKYGYTPPVKARSAAAAKGAAK
jgi:electron transport complex protein RnfD